MLRHSVCDGQTSCLRRTARHSACGVWRWKTARRKLRAVRDSPSRVPLLTDRRGTPPSPQKARLTQGGRPPRSLPLFGVALATLRSRSPRSLRRNRGRLGPLRSASLSVGSRFAFGLPRPPLRVAAIRAASLRGSRRVWISARRRANTRLRKRLTPLTAPSGWTVHGTRPRPARRLMSGRSLAVKIDNLLDKRSASPIYRV